MWHTLISEGVGKTSPQLLGGRLGRCWPLLRRRFISGAALQNLALSLNWKWKQKSLQHASTPRLFIDKPFNRRTESGTYTWEELIKILPSTSPSVREWRPLTSSFHLCWPRTKVSFSNKWTEGTDGETGKLHQGRARPRRPPPTTPTSLNQAKQTWYTLDRRGKDLFLSLLMDQSSSPLCIKKKMCAEGRWTKYL